VIKPARFELLRYFSIASLVAIVMGATLSGMFYRQLALTDLTELGERETVALTQAFANSIWPQFAPFLTSAAALAPDQLQRHPETARLRKTIIAQMGGLSVVRVKIYDLTGLTVFSTEPSQLGEDKSGNPGFLSARAGKPASTLTYRGQMDSFEGIIENRNILSSYVPIRRGDPGGPIEGVFELYSDVTPLLDRIKSTQLKVVIGSVLVFASLYLVLFFIVRHADRTLRRQENERKQAAEALRKAHDELEMRVHERTAELQRANEALRTGILERRVIEGALRESQAQFAGIIGSAMDGIITIDEDQRVVLFNSAAERIFRCSAAEVMGQPIDRFIPERFRDKNGEGVRAFARADATDREKGRHLSMIGLRADGEEIAVEATISQSEAAGQPIYTIILRDITERQRGEETLRKLSRVVEQTGDSVFVTDRDGTIEYVNPSFEELTGFSQEEAIGANPRILKSGKHDQRFFENLWNTILSGEVFRSVFTNKRKDGRLYYEDQTITPIRDSHGNITHFVSTGRDITQHTRTEQELRSSHEQLRALAAHLESVREDERGRVAREVHDELGQALTALKFDLSWLANRLAGENPGLLAETRAMIKLVDSTIQLVRRISTELRPGVLDDLGLVAALEWQAQDFKTRTGIACAFSSGVADTGPDREVATALFRICQETLTNVIRHAEASTVEIFLEEESAHLILSVRDNGKGIRAEEIANGKSMGILGMRERARLLGGHVSIVGRPGEGTRVTVGIPLKRAQGNMA